MKPVKEDEGKLLSAEKGLLSIRHLIQTSW